MLLPALWIIKLMHRIVQQKESCDQSEGNSDLHCAILPLTVGGNWNEKCTIAAMCHSRFADLLKKMDILFIPQWHAIHLGLLGAITWLC